MEVNMDQVRELASCYEQCGLGETSSGRFLRSIVQTNQMPRGGGVGWLNDLVTKGNPQSVAPLVAEIENLIARSGRSDTVNSLLSILNKVKAGWKLTEHTQSELERLRKQVNDALPDLELDERSRHLLTGLETRKRFSSYSYWQARPVISTRLDGIFTRWRVESKISPDDWEFVRENFKGPITEFQGGKHPIGSLRWNRLGVPVTIMEEPLFNDQGDVVIKVLAKTGVANVRVKTLLIRAPK